uniref:Uncharacterized protein n=1 Tax=Arundo donax TaxID=35708 RepID=A0A0A9D9P8_ARUDO
MHVLVCRRALGLRCRHRRRSCRRSRRIFCLSHDPGSANPQWRRAEAEHATNRRATETCYQTGLQKPPGRR